jgi:uncharacterized repeat protein (TIGR03803 family)
MPYLFRTLLGAFAAALLSTVSAGATSVTTLYSVTGSSDGNGPTSALIDVGGTFYGTTFFGGTAGYGTVFSINSETGAKTAVYSFAGGSDGAYPQAALLSVGSTLYGTTWSGGTSGNGTVFSINPATGAEAVVHSFAGGADGASPLAALISVGGMLYGTTSSGGTTGNGTVFSINPATGAETVLYSFAGGTDGAGPGAALLNDGGIFYGTTELGGTTGNGTVFSINPATGAETVLYSFEGGADGDRPIASLIEVGGTLYGTTTLGGTGSSYDYGTLFSFNPATGAHLVLHQFTGGSDGDQPQTGLLRVGGTLYGTTSFGGASNGTVFSFNLAKGLESVVYSFAGGSDGSYPTAALVSADKTLYGTTEFGGPANAGTVFSVNPATGTETVLYSFTGGAVIRSSDNALQNINSTLFLSSSVGGSANLGDVVEINPANGTATELIAFTNAAEGAYPEAALIEAGSTVYGTTESGGNGSCTGGCGTVYSVNPVSGAETVLYSFAGGQDGIAPVATLLDVNDTLYGTTSAGGTYGQGTVFSINPATGAETVLHSFAGGDDGARPEAELINVGGIFYGTTFLGGTGCHRHAQGCGTAFSINPATGAETVLYSFGGKGGSYPAASLVDVGGTLYGTASDEDGVEAGGVVFSLNPATRQETIIHGFGAAGDGADPQAALINFGGILYGTTFKGGAYGGGTVFSINPAKKRGEKVLYSFTGGSDGGSPTAALVNIGSALYGTTSTFGAAQRGTVFELVP